MSEYEKVVKKEFTDCSDGLHDNDAANIPPVKFQSHDIVEKKEQQPFKEAKNDTAEYELPTLFQNIPVRGARIYKKATLEECGKRHHD